MKYILYSRTSTNDQHLGIEAQRKTAYSFIKSDDVIMSEFTEKESGRNPNRPQLLKAIKACEQTGSKLLIARLDRLSRNAKFTLELVESKVPFVCCDMPDANPLTIGIMAVLAEAEAVRISHNTKKALAIVKERLALEGRKLGTNNLSREGVIKSAKKRSEEAKKDNHQATKIILRLRLDKRTFKSIAAELNEDGYLTSAKNKFLEASVCRLYNRAMVA